MVYSGRGVLDLWRMMEERKLNKYVSVDREAAVRYARELKSDGKKLDHWRILGVTPQDDLAFARSNIVESAINFCYWLPDDPDKKFTIENELDLWRPYRGALAMSRCFYRVLGETPILSYHLKRHFCSLEKTKEFFRGRYEIPMLENRYWLMREVIDVLDSDFKGDPLRVYEESEWDAVKLVCLLARKFPNSFGSDVSRIYLDGGEAEIRFYKKAKLVAVLYQGRALEKGSRLKPLSNMREILAVEDYQVPRVLRHKGILVYSDELSEGIASRRIIYPHSMKEIEIRLSLSPANYYMLEELNQGLGSDHPDYWDIVPLDALEWKNGRGIKTTHHLTPTAAY